MNLFLLLVHSELLVNTQLIHRINKFTDQSESNQIMRSTRTMSKYSNCGNEWANSDRFSGKKSE